MTRILLLLFFTGLFSVSSLAQENNKAIQIKMGYLGHVAIQPGINISVQLPLPSNSPFRTKSDSRGFVLTPSVGVFNRSDISTNLFIDTHLGIYSFRKKKRHSLSSIGLGYLFESKVESFSVSLGTGSRSNSQRKESHFFVPSLAQEFGGRLSRNLRLYNRYVLGYKFSRNAANAAVFFVELGVTYTLK